MSYIKFQRVPEQNWFLIWRMYLHRLQSSLRANVLRSAPSLYSCACRVELLFVPSPINSLSLSATDVERSLCPDRKHSKWHCDVTWRVGGGKLGVFALEFVAVVVAHLQGRLVWMERSGSCCGFAEDRPTSTPHSLRLRGKTKEKHEMLEWS